MNHFVIVLIQNMSVISIDAAGQIGYNAARPLITMLFKEVLVK